MEIVSATSRTTPAASAAPSLSADDLLARVDELAWSLDAAHAAVCAPQEALQEALRRVGQELRLAGRVQRDFLPKTLPAVGSVRFAAYFRPAGHVSGDLYDVTRLDECHVGFYLADAIGHGLPAALLTMFLKNVWASNLKRTSPQGYRLLTPAKTLRKLNAALVGQQLTEAPYATALSGLVDCVSGVCRIARAGHPHPLLLRAGRTSRPVGGEGAMLGVFEHEMFETHALRLKPGDRLVCYTDGFEVAWDPVTPDAERFKVEIDRLRHLPVKSILSELAETLPRGGVKDDLTVVIVERVD